MFQDYEHLLCCFKDYTYEFESLLGVPQFPWCSNRHRNNKPQPPWGSEIFMKGIPSLTCFIVSFLFYFLFFLGICYLKSWEAQELLNSWPFLFHLLLFFFFVVVFKEPLEETCESLSNFSTVEDKQTFMTLSSWEIVKLHFLFFIYSKLCTSLNLCFTICFPQHCSSSALAILQATPSFLLVALVQLSWFPGSLFSLFPSFHSFSDLLVAWLL